MSDKSKKIWVEYVRTFAILGVVMLHSAAPILYKMKYISEYYWWIGNIYDSIVRCSVPLFFMLSGYLLINREENVSDFIKKRLNKAIIPLLAWSIIYIAWRIFYEESLELSPKALWSIILSPAYNHLWFMYAIVGLYLSMPILRGMMINLDRAHLIYFVVLWLFAYSIIPAIRLMTGVVSNIDLSMFAGNVGFLVLGFLLGNINLPKNTHIKILPLLITSIGVTAYGTFWLTKNNSGIYSGYFYSYASPNVIFMSAALFVILKHLIESCHTISLHRITPWVYSISSASFGIYLVHPIFLMLLDKGNLGFVLNSLSGNPLYFVPVTTFAVFTLSYLFTVVVKKIPIIKHIVP